MFLLLISISIFLAGAFGRRASDGGTNFHIYYPTNSNNGPNNENVYSQQNSRECLNNMVIGVNDKPIENALNVEGVDESTSDEIQRYDKLHLCS